MPNIYDNIDKGTALVPALRQSLKAAKRCDFSVGYFNLWGWNLIDDLVDDLEGTEESRVRLLVGMHSSPAEEVKAALSLQPEDNAIDNSRANKMRKRVAEDFRNQLLVGAPSNQSEAALRRLRDQLLSGKLVVKLHLSMQLHAKLYLFERDDIHVPKVGYVGSSNLTLSGIQKQAELNIDVLDQDATVKLSAWFERRWNERYSLDITKELAEILDESWINEKLIDPYLIYLKIAYHLSSEARAGVSEFSLPKVFEDKLFDFQAAAVKIAAHHLNRRGGVMIGDVVGLGKTLLSTALARVFEDDYGAETLIICPKNLTKMWESYRTKYGLRGQVLSTSKVHRELPDMRRYRLVLIDESHNLRNREGKKYRAIREYIERNDSKCILLSATPYNKSYLDLSAQLELFVPREADIGIRPEKLISSLNGVPFGSKYQTPMRSLASFEHSEHEDDWRDLMRQYLVRRTRGFIKENYAHTDPTTGRKYLEFPDGKRSYFPDRKPLAAKFTSNADDEDDLYGQLFSSEVVDAINGLYLPRYGLGNYTNTPARLKKLSLTSTQKQTLDDLGKAGKRLMGFCRTGLFKRLESSGKAFVQSLERHALRNHVFLYALEHGLDVPIGTQESALLEEQSVLNTQNSDVDQEQFDVSDISANAEASEESVAGVDSIELLEAGGTATITATATKTALNKRSIYRKRAETVYKDYAGRKKSSYKWLPAKAFGKKLAEELTADADALIEVLDKYGDWDPEKDLKLARLEKLLKEDHPGEKVLIFTQFADTVDYLTEQLKERGVKSLEGVTGGSNNPTDLAWRFSPVSNEKRIEVSEDRELRVLVATDVLSEGQNLQDCRIVVNFDLPWAIIQLIQRAGRVDRIGQEADEILCYSFIPAEGVENIINLRSRVMDRLKENAAVIGADDKFFEDEDETSSVLGDLYNEKAGTLDGDDDGEVDLASQAFQIWKNAVDADPSLRKKVESLSDISYSARYHEGTPARPDGVLMYMRTPDGSDALTWIDSKGKIVTQSQTKILEMAQCHPATKPIERSDKHHELVERAAKHIIKEHKRGTTGQLGSPRSARHRVYMLMKGYIDHSAGLFATDELKRAVDMVFRYPLKQSAADRLNRQMRSGISTDELANVLVNLYEDEALCVVDDEPDEHTARIICSMGLHSETSENDGGGA